MTDPAIAAIVRVFKQAAADKADLEWAAREVLTVLRGLGWRPTSAQPAPPWQPPGPGVPPNDAWQAARQAMQERGA